MQHWTVADREAHEKMGFYGGWGICANQLEALASKLQVEPPGFLHDDDRRLHD